MDSDDSQSTQRAPEEIPPAALLQLPSDWFNFLEDGDDVVAARRRYESLLDRIFPQLEPHAREQGIETMLGWRETIWNAGLLTHGILTAPPVDGSGPVLWQIVITLVKVPAIRVDVDAGALLSQFWDRGIENSAHIEKFETRLGFGAGFVAQTPVPAEVKPQRSPYAMGGTAGALSSPHEGGWSILVMGMSFDADQAAQLGWLVGQIAGHSTLEAQGEESTASPQPGVAAVSSQTTKIVRAS
jgi:hypothetical protein